MVRLPLEYQEVEYLESTGTQYIELDFGFDPTDKIETKFSITDTRTNDKYIVSPVEWNTNNNRFAMGVHWVYAIGFGGANTSTTKFSPNMNNDGHIHEWHYSNRLFEIVDLGRSKNVSAINFGSTTANLRLFYGYNTNTSGKIASYHHKKADGMEINLIPCYRKPDNKHGMYDTVSKTFYTNSGTGEFLVGNNVYYDTTNLFESRRRILLTTPHLESPTPANPLTFRSNMTTKLKEGKVYFTPIQEGTGDPSPDNVRPILGWDGITVTISKDNVWDEQWELGYYSVFTGLPVANSGYIRCKNRILVKNSKEYCFVHPQNKGDMQILWYDRNDNYISYNTLEGVRAHRVYTSPSSACYVRFYLGLQYGTTYNNDVSVNCNPTNTSYEPYTGTQIAIPFPQTIYGGYVDLVNGEVVEEWHKWVEDGSRAPSYWIWQQDSTNNVYTALFSALPSEYRHNADFGYIEKVKCPTRKYVGINSQARVNSNIISLYRAASGASFAYSFTGAEFADMTKADLQAYLAENPIEAVYILQTPIHHTIDPQVIRPLKGTNTIYSDANGNIEIKFWKH